MQQSRRQRRQSNGINAQQSFTACACKQKKCSGIPIYSYNFLMPIQDRNLHCTPRHGLNSEVSVRVMYQMCLQCNFQRRKYIPTCDHEGSDQWLLQIYRTWSTRPRMLWTQLSGITLIDHCHLSLTLGTM